MGPGNGQVKYAQMLSLEHVGGGVQVMGTTVGAPKAELHDSCGRVGKGVWLLLDKVPPGSYIQVRKPTTKPFWCPLIIWYRYQIVTNLLLQLLGCL